jgi:hypothetical protein
MVGAVLKFATVTEAYEVVPYGIVSIERLYVPVENIVLLNYM